MKNGFKALFGCTIFGYLTNLRMAQARKLIKEDGYTVSEASFMVGYKHPQHFVNAFKKQFGYTPGVLK